jgi:hypothetical protein
MPTETPEDAADFSPDRYDQPIHWTLAPSPGDYQALLRMLFEPAALAARDGDD